MKKLVRGFKSSNQDLARYCKNYEVSGGMLLGANFGSALVQQRMLDQTEFGYLTEKFKSGSRGEFIDLNKLYSEYTEVEREMERNGELRNIVPARGPQPGYANPGPQPHYLSGGPQPIQAQYGPQPGYTNPGPRYGVVSGGPQPTQSNPPNFVSGGPHSSHHAPGAPDQRKLTTNFLRAGPDHSRIYPDGHPINANRTLINDHTSSRTWQMFIQEFYQKIQSNVGINQTQKYLHFRKFDKDGSGSLQYNELKEFFES